MCEDVSGTALQEEKDICTQRLAEKRVRSLAVCGRGVWDAHYGARRARWQEGCLKKRPLDLFQMGLPELQVTTGDECRSNGIVKNIFDSKLSNNAGLVIWNPKFLCNFVASLWRKDICRFDGSEGQEEIILRLRYIQVKRKYGAEHLSNTTQLYRTPVSLSQHFIDMMEQFEIL